MTYSAGFRHDSIPLSDQVLQQVAASSGVLQLVPSEDLSLISESGLHNFDGVLFFTSGELPISDEQKQALLAFVRAGGGFGGVHSATDTFYTWPEYGDLIGARFNGHPWVQNVRIDIEDPDHPAVSFLRPAFSIFDEIYQFREFSRDRVRVLMTLDTRSVDLSAAGTNSGTDDFPLAWCRNYGNGRVFYAALGHFEETWRDPRFQQMMLQALRWMTGLAEADATPRVGSHPAVLPDGIGNSASFTPRMAISPGSLISIFGSQLTSGSVEQAGDQFPVFKLAGTSVRLNGTAIPLLYVSPGQVNAYVPLDLQPRNSMYALELSVAGGGTAAMTLAALDATPGIFTYTMGPDYVTLWATGLGPVDPSGAFQVTRTQPTAAIGGVTARVLFSGLAPTVPVLYQVNIELPPNFTPPAMLDFRFGNYEQHAVLQR